MALQRRASDATQTRLYMITLLNPQVAAPCTGARARFVMPFCADILYMLWWFGGRVNRRGPLGRNAVHERRGRLHKLGLV